MIETDKVYGVFTGQSLPCNQCENYRTYFPMFIYHNAREVLLCCTICGEKKIMSIRNFLYYFVKIDYGNYSKLTVKSS